MATYKVKCDHLTAQRLFRYSIDAFCLSSNSTASSLTQPKSTGRHSKKTVTPTEAAAKEEQLVLPKQSSVKTDYTSCVSPTHLTRDLPR